jgi:hypothetical protein
LFPAFWHLPLGIVEVIHVCEFSYVRRWPVTKEGNSGKLKNPWQLSGDDISKNHPKEDPHDMSLDTRGLTVKQKALQGLADAATDLWNVFDTIEIYTHELEKVTGLGNLDSSKAMENKYGNAGGDNGLRKEVKSHKRILKSLAETFVSAGKLYVNSDEASGEVFDRLTGASVARGPAVGVPPTIDGKTELPAWARKDKDGDAKYPGLPARLERLRHDDNQRDKTPVIPEPKGWMTLEPVGRGPGGLISLRESLDPESVSDKARMWEWLANMLGKPVDHLINTMSSVVNSGGWTSDASRKAGNAVIEYAESVSSLQSAMMLLHEGMRDAAGWVRDAKHFLPTLELWESERRTSDVKTAKDVREWTDLYRETYENYYRRGVKASSSAVPLIPPPRSPLAAGPLKPPGMPKDPGSHSNETGGGHTRHQGSGGTPPTGGATPPPSGGTLSGAGAPSGGDASPTGNDTRVGRNGPDAGAPHAGGDTRGGVPSTQQTYEKQYQRQIRSQEQKSAERERNRQKQIQDQANQQQRNYEKQIKQQNAQQKSQESQQALMQGLQQVQQLIQQGLQSAQEAVQQGLQQAATNRLPGMPDTPVGPDAAKALGIDPLAGGGGGSSAPGGATELPKNSAPASKLFPRATVNPESLLPGRAGIPAQPGQPGTSGTAGSPGHAPHGAGGQHKGHTRPAYLTSAEHLQDAFGEAPMLTKPVVDQ